MQTLKRFGLFWVDFIVGDDWTLAVVVIAGLLATWGLSHTGFPGWVALPVIIMTALVASVRRARRLRRSGARSGKPASVEHGAPVRSGRRLRSPTTLPCPDCLRCLETPVSAAFRDIAKGDEADGKAATGTGTAPEARDQDQGRRG